MAGVVCVSAPFDSKRQLRLWKSDADYFEGTCDGPGNCNRKENNKKSGDMLVLFGRLFSLFIYKET